ncbi:MAG: hypothetical protein AAGI11_10735 [Pseudomonadota bacterium]
MKPRLALAGFIGLLALTGSVGVLAQPEKNPEGLAYHYMAKTNEQGSCQPERRDLANAEALALYAVRGETVFAMPDGDTVIPFQSVFGSFDDDGYSKDQSISILNFSGPCSGLVITVTVEYCEYGAPDFGDRACPDIQVTGVEGFAGVEFIREDTKSD